MKFSLVSEPAPQISGLSKGGIRHWKMLSRFCYVAVVDGPGVGVVADRVAVRYAFG